MSQEQKFNEVWDSLEPEVRGDLERLYHRLMTIKNEAQLEGVRNQVLYPALQKRFWNLWKTIGREC